jgi:hypothetical protein
MSNAIDSTRPQKRHNATLRHEVSMLTALALGTFALASCAANGAYEAPSTTGAVAQPHAAHQLLVDSAACWLGGIWGDVQGQTPEQRTSASEARCSGVIVSVYGHTDERRYLQLRAFDPETLQEVKNKIGHLASRDPAEARHQEALGNVFTKLAYAEREAMLARRAARRVLRDLDHEQEKLNDEEAIALPELESSAAFDELLRVDAGDLRAEAHAFALMVLLDRLRIAEQVPVHLKPYVVTGPLHAVFGVPIPELPHDASRPLARGEWLTYLVDVATQARHPVDVAAETPIAKHEAAMAGILEGVADQLRADAPGIAPETSFARVAQLTIRALEQSRQRAAL